MSECNHHYPDGQLAIYGETDSRGYDAPYANCDLCGARWRVRGSGRMVPTDDPRSWVW